MKAQTAKSEASFVQMKNRVLLDVQNAWLSLQTNRNFIDLSRKNRASPGRNGIRIGHCRITGPAG